MMLTENFLLLILAGTSLQRSANSQAGRCSGSNCGACRRASNCRAHGGVCSWAGNSCAPSSSLSTPSPPSRPPTVPSSRPSTPTSGSQASPSPAPGSQGDVDNFGACLLVERCNKMLECRIICDCAPFICRSRSFTDDDLHEHIRSDLILPRVSCTCKLQQIDPDNDSRTACCFADDAHGEGSCAELRRAGYRCRSYFCRPSSEYNGFCDEMCNCGGKW